MAAGGRPPGKRGGGKGGKGPTGSRGKSGKAGGSGKFAASGGGGKFKGRGAGGSAKVPGKRAGGDAGGVDNAARPGRRSGPATGSERSAAAQSSMSISAARGAALPAERTVYGRHPVREAIRGPRTIKAIHVTAAALRELGDDLPSGIPIREVDSGALQALAGTPDHQGVVAEVEPFSYCSIDELLRADAAPIIICLDQVTDPHNLGAIARVCDAAGATGIVLPEHRSVRVTGAVCKASAGAIEHVRVAVVTNIADTLERAKGPGMWAYGASEHGTRPYTEADFTDGVFFVFGSEGAGLRPRVREHCDELLQVPMRGSVSSLNVATVAALFAYEVVRQRGGDEVDG